MKLEKSHSKFEQLVDKILKESLYGGTATSSPVKFQQQTGAPVAPQSQVNDGEMLKKQIEVAQKETEEAKKQAEELKKQRKDLEDYQKKMVAIQAQAASKTATQPSSTGQTTPQTNAPIAGANVQQVIQNLLNMGKIM